MSKMEDPRKQAKRISNKYYDYVLVCAPGSDVTFQSSDGVLFCVHRKNLETHAGGFPPAEFDTMGEVVPLTEDASTLELLFHFIYPVLQSEHGSTTFEILFPLAEAAEKYEVFSAMSICRIQMRKFISQHPEKIIIYAVKHDYRDIIAEAAPLMLVKPLPEILSIMPPHIIVPWVLYYERWSQVLQSVASFHKAWANENSQPLRYIARRVTCSHCGEDIGMIIVRILAKLVDIKSLQGRNKIFQDCTLGEKHPQIVAWEAWLAKRIDNIPQFTSFLFS